VEEELGVRRKPFDARKKHLEPRRRAVGTCGEMS
jgi:hypothetical protein